MARRAGQGPPRTLSFAWLPRALLTLLILLIPLLILRLLRVFHPSFRRSPRPRRRGTPTRLLVVLGSGGHTAEMFAMLRRLGREGLQDYTHRTYLVGQGDDFSASWAKQFEEEIMGVTPPADPADGREKHDVEDTGGEGGRDEKGPADSWQHIGKDETTSPTPDTDSTVPSTYDITFVPRARAIHQSLWTTPLSVLATFVAVLPVLAAPFTTASALTAANFLALERSRFRRSLAASRSPDGVQARMALAALDDLDGRPEPPMSTLEPPPGDEDAEGEGNRVTYTWPAVVLTNGPANGAVVTVAAMALRVLDWGGCESRHRALRAVYVESWARVKRMSLTGRIVARVVDRCVVQWEELAGEGREFRGVLV